MNTNILRLILIALPLTLLIACGGGGGGGTAAAPTNMPDPMTPPVTLPGYVITNLAPARMAVGGTAPTTNMTEMEIVSAIQTRATAADYFAFSDFDAMEDSNAVSVAGETNDRTYSAMVPGVGALAFSLDDIEDLSLVDDTGLMDFDSETQLVMKEGGATIIQSQSAAGQGDTRLSFQSYGGWFTNSVFGVVSLDVLESGETTSRFASFSFGKETEMRPTGSPLFQYTGVMVGSTNTGDLLQGNLTVQYLTSTPGSLNAISFDNVKNLNNGEDFRFGVLSRLQFSNIPLDTNGRFESDSSDIKGSFYGDNGAQIGGIFNHSLSNVVGSFGGVKQ